MGGNHGPDVAVVEVARAALARAGLGGLTAVPLASGTDAAVFAAGPVVVAVRQAGDVAREAELLRFVAGLGLPVAVPEVLHVETTALVTTRLPGSTLLGRPLPEDAAPVLAELLTRLHTAERPPHGVPVEPFALAEWTDELEGPEELVARTVEEAPSVLTGAPVLCHADLGAEHLLADEGRLTGVVDWADGCLTDRAVDFARLLRDFGPDVVQRVLACYRPADEVDRGAVTFFARCAALEDLRFGERTGRADYATAARRSLAWLF
jgi:aminoglycoside phosphotransferase (APT) family kinase protein